MTTIRVADWIMRRLADEGLRHVFVLPGVGRLVFQAIANRDLVVVRDVVMLLVAVVVLVNLVVDLLYLAIDPRLRRVRG